MIESIPIDLLARLDLLVLFYEGGEQADGQADEQPGAMFLVVGRAPDWFQRFFSESPARLTERRLSAAFPFLANFLIDARGVWEREPSAPLDSGIWTETDPAGEQVMLVATAMRLGARPLLLIDGNQHVLGERVALLQKAREGLWAHQRLLRTVDQKDILFHCIVHDLATQISTIRGSLQLLQSDVQSQHAKDVAAAGLRGTTTQEELARDILSIFEMEQLGVDTDADRNTTPRRAGLERGADLLACAKSVVQLQQMAAGWRKVELRLQAPGDPDASWPVVGERSRLDRVIANLIDNALRYAPRGTTVTVGLADCLSHSMLSVDDAGPGVATGLCTTLFDKFARDRNGRGRIGLGLYFCRLTIEAWGGQIGYAQRPPQGSRFWFRLPKSS